MPDDNDKGTTDYEKQRHQMVRRQIEARGIRDRTVLEAMREVPRELFIPEEVRELAYTDQALPIREEQTISQPYIVALMTAALRLGKSDLVLEVGAGSGYAAAVLSRVAKQVFTIERHSSLVEMARLAFRRLGYENIQIRCGDGTQGWPEEAPFQGISVTAGGRRVPRALESQLALGGRLVIPVGATPRTQKLIEITRIDETKFATEELTDVRFVPLVGS